MGLSNKCNKCGRLIKDEREYCSRHRYLNKNFKAARRNEMNKIRAKPEYKAKQSIYMKEYYRKNKEGFKQYHKTYYSNPIVKEKEKERAKVYYSQHAEERKTYSKNYRKKQLSLKNENITLNRTIP
jgi:hypothetical protein